MPIKYGNDVSVNDIVYGDGQPLRKIIEFESTTNGDTFLLPDNYLKLDNEDRGNIYPPVSYLAFGHITNVEVLNAGSRQVRVTFTVSISFYDPNWDYQHMWQLYNTEGIGVYYYIGNTQNWEFASFPFTATSPNVNGWWIGYGTWQATYTMTQQEWELYGYKEVVIYEEPNVYVWEPINTTPSQYYNIEGDFNVLNQLYPPSKVFNNKYALTNEAVVTNEFYYSWNNFYYGDTTTWMHYWASDTANGTTNTYYTEDLVPTSNSLPSASSFKYKQRVKLISITSLQEAYFTIKLRDAQLTPMNYTFEVLETDFGGYVNTIIPVEHYMGTNPAVYTVGTTIAIMWINNQKSQWEGVIWVVTKATTTGYQYYQCKKIS